MGLPGCHLPCAATWSPPIFPQGVAQSFQQFLKGSWAREPALTMNCIFTLEGLVADPPTPVRAPRFSHCSLGASAFSPFPPWTMPHRVLEELWVPGGEGNKTIIFSF